MDTCTFDITFLGFFGISTLYQVCLDYSTFLTRSSFFLSDTLTLSVKFCILDSVGLYLCQNSWKNGRKEVVMIKDDLVVF